MSTEAQIISPIFGCRGVPLKESAFEAHKAFQKAWVVINEQGLVVTEEACPRLKQVETGLDGTHLTIAFPGMFFRLSLTGQPKTQTEAIIEGQSRTVGLEPLLYSQALSQFLGLQVRLVRL